MSECDVAGMRDVGLYRVSGVLSDIQKLKKAFEKSELHLLFSFIFDAVSDKQFM